MIGNAFQLLAIAWLAAAQAPNAPAAAGGAGAAQKAPFVFSYRILGSPIVGQPVAINLEVASEQSEPITLEYRIIDTSSLQFPESQALTVQVRPSPDEVSARQQVTVVPQREGRLFLNVSGSVETEAGTVIRATAIPIQVAAAPKSSASEASADGDDEALEETAQN